MPGESSFVAFRAQRLRADDLLAEVRVVKESGDEGASRLAEIEYRLARGHEHFYRRRYWEALREYKSALGLSYQLAEPGFDPRLAQGLEVMLPARRELFAPIVQSVLSVMERAPATVPEVVVAPERPLEAAVVGSLRRYSDLGVAAVGESAGSAGVSMQERLGNQYAAAGQHGQAAAFFSEAIAALPENAAPVERGRLHMALGMAQGELGRTDEAVTQFGLAREAHTLDGDSVVAAMAFENAATALARAGRYGEARRSLDAAEGAYRAVRAASGGSLGSSTIHDLNNASVRVAQQRNGYAAMQQRGSMLGRLRSALGRSIQPEMIPAPAFRAAHGPDAVAGPPAEVSANPHRALRLAAGTEVVAGRLEPHFVDIDLGSANSASVIEEEVYRRRVSSQTLDELGIWSGPAYAIDHARVQIPHQYYFSIRVCLGDTYAAIGQFEQALAYFEQARDYQYLNLALEAPAVWTRIARCLVNWGFDFYRKGATQLALERFRQVADATNQPATIPDASPLYGQTPFAGVQAEVEPYLATMDSATPSAINAEIAILLHRSIVYQSMIAAGLNSLGLPANPIPIFRFRYLQAVARYFAEQAIKAERDFINFKANNEQETASLMQLQQAEAVAAETVKLEQARVAEAIAEQALAARSRDLAQLRATNAQDRRNEYVTVSRDRVTLDTATAHASGGFTETEGGYQVTLTSTGETVNLGDEDYEIMRNAAWHRGMIQRGFELNDMQRTIDEYNANVVVSSAQLDLANRRRAIADQNRVIADLRLAHTQANRQFAQDKTFNAELWSNLADQMRELAQLYLDRATEIALLMQAAYNFESDVDLDKIALSYATSEDLGGLLGGDTLLSDINYFTYHYITQTVSKEIPAKSIISLAERYPYVLVEFRETGRAEFETKLEDFDALYPGSYMQRVKAIEVVVEGLIGADGISGTMKNTGSSAYRTRTNQVETRLQPEETMLLSSYSLKNDVVVFRPSEETRGVFEGSGAASGWTVELPFGANDLNYRAISDIKLVLYYTAFHDATLETTVRATLPTTGQRARMVSLRFNYPDAFFLLLDTGAASFTIEARDFPYYQLNPTVSRLALYVLSEGGTSPASIAVGIATATGGHAATPTTGTDGTVSADPADATAVLNVFTGDSPLDEWTVTIDRATNPTLFVEEPAGSGLFRIRGLRDVVLAFDYDFDVRTA